MWVFYRFGDGPNVWPKDAHASRIWLPRTLVRFLHFKDSCFYWSCSQDHILACHFWGKELHLVSKVFPSEPGLNSREVRWGIGFFSGLFSADGRRGGTGLCTHKKEFVSWFFFIKDNNEIIDICWRPLKHHRFLQKVSFGYVNENENDKKVVGWYKAGNLTTRDRVSTRLSTVSQGATLDQFAVIPASVLPLSHWSVPRP